MWYFCRNEALKFQLNPDERFCFFPFPFFLLRWLHLAFAFRSKAKNVTLSDRINERESWKMKKKWKKNLIKYHVYLGPSYFCVYFFLSLTLSAVHPLSFVCVYLIKNSYFITVDYMRERCPFKHESSDLKPPETETTIANRTSSWTSSSAEFAKIDGNKHLTQRQRNYCKRLYEPFHS